LFEFDSSVYFIDSIVESLISNFSKCGLYYNTQHSQLNITMHESLIEHTGNTVTY